MSNSSVWCIDSSLSGVTTTGKSRPGTNRNERVICIPQSSSITGVSSSFFNVISGYLLKGGLTPLQRSSRCILQPQPTGLMCVWVKQIKKSKVGDLSRGWPKGSLINSYYTEALERALLHSPDCSNLLLILTL